MNILSDAIRNSEESSVVAIKGKKVNCGDTRRLYSGGDVLA